MRTGDRVHLLPTFILVWADPVKSSSLAPPTKYQDDGGSDFLSVLESVAEVGLSLRQNFGILPRSIDASPLLSSAHLTNPVEDISHKEQDVIAGYPNILVITTSASIYPLSPSSPSRRYPWTMPSFL